MSIFGPRKHPTCSIAVSEKDVAMFARRRRNRIAEKFALTLASHKWDYAADSWHPEALASLAVEMADALIAELDK